MSDAGYLVRRLTAGRFEVSKWGLSSEPDAVYVLTRTLKCDCPAGGRMRCKHAALVQRFLAEERTRDPFKMYEP
jgi:uncharacterized Zn finger protein